MEYANATAVYFNSEEIIKDDIVWGLLELGVEVERPELLAPMQEYSESIVQAILPLIQGRTFVITQDFSAAVAKACSLVGIPYVSWIYDSPQRSLYLEEALLPTNYIFAFDKKQCERLQEIGIKNVFHQPLAGNLAKSSMLEITDADLLNYASDVSFVGQLYQRSYQEDFFRLAPKLVKKQFDDYFSKVVCNWNNDVSIFNRLGLEAEHYLVNSLREKDYLTYHIDRKYAGEVLVMATTIAGMERKRILQEAASLGHCDFYTKDDVSQEDLPGVFIHPPVGSDTEIYKVYFASKINLNVTMRAIETGIPQRIFDIMSVGGFVLTNAQEEIEELFTPGVDLEVYHSIDEMKDKINYYLSHEKERIRIAINGYQKVRDYYTYPMLLAKMLKEIGLG